MATPYPGSLPCPTITITGNPVESFKRTDFDFGTRYRKNYCSVYTVDMKWIFTPEEMRTFRTWYWSQLDNGTLPFEADWDIEAETGTKEFHFFNPYKWKQNETLGKNFEVTATLELKTKINED